MSDSVDRVFVHALATVRRLPRTGSSRPPTSARLRLYGLYKQSMEGDVSAILPRPTLPVTSPNPNDRASNAVHRYASRDLRTKETQAEIEKWDAWHACAGMSRTEAKRRYISTLIDTMKEYASGTSESRELVSELEFVWNQIKSQSGSDESDENESSTRKLERAGMKQPGSPPIDHPPGPGRGKPSGANARKNSIYGFSRVRSHSDNDNSSSYLSRRQSQIAAGSGLRVLSPKSPRSTDDIVENEELSHVHPDAEPLSDEDEDQDQDRHRDAGGIDDEEYDENAYRTTPSSPTSGPAQNLPIPDSTATDVDGAYWRTQIEAHLSRLTLELTALREQLSSNSLLSRSFFAPPSNYATLPLRSRIYHRASAWIRWILYTAVRQFVIHLVLLLVVVVYGRWRNDRRVETWVKARLRETTGYLRSWRKRRWDLRVF